ncbi:unnamed protein product [Symbiodinium sp. CCMP2592]|nr:unnamed protein product [Symbiodinium sp. CCMP2592]
MVSEAKVSVNQDSSRAQAMKLPTPVRWPESAVSFLLIGGQDNFRGRLSVEDYVAETRSHVPLANKTTAILFVQEMTHMPQQPLLRGVLRLMLKAIASWKVEGKLPLEQFRNILAFLRQEQCSYECPGETFRVVVLLAASLQQL